MKKKIVLKILVCTLLSTAIVGIAIYKAKPSKLESEVEEGLLPTLTEHEKETVTNRLIDEGSFNATISNVILLDSQELSGRADIQNIANNHYNIGVEISLNQNYEVVYQSEIMQPDSYIERIKLQSDLGIGEYPATAVFTAYDPEDDSVVGTMSMSVTLKVMKQI